MYVDLPSFSVPNVNAPELLRLRASTLGAIASRGVPVPKYDRSHLQPRIAHIGVGGFHRAHLALYTHELAQAGSDWGIVGVGLLAQDAEMARVLHAQDGLYTLSEKGSGEPTPQIIGSLLRFLHSADSDEAFQEFDCIRNDIDHFAHHH